MTPLVHLMRSSLATGSVAALLTLGLPAAARAQATDHFTCYKATATSGVLSFVARPGVSLVDHYRASTVAVKTPKLLCAPTNKNGENPSAPSHPDHLEDYQIKPTVKFTPLRNQRVDNQFGTIFVDVRKPVALQVPTAKRLDSTPPAPTDPAVDHFTCYQVKVASGTAKFVPIPGVTIEDQFGPMTVTVLRPRRLCLPTNKNNEEPGAETHPDHLMCYQIKQTSLPRFVTAPGLFTNNQFGSERLDAKNPAELCVPTVLPLISAPGDTSQIALVSSTVVSGYQVDYYRNTAYPCSISGYQTFAIGYQLGVPTTTAKPLWVFMHGGGVGYFDSTGAPQPPDEYFMHEETLADLVGHAALPGLMEQVRNDPAGFRLLVVSMCNRDLYGGANLPDPNNPNLQPNGDAITTNGFYATKAAIQFAQAQVATTKFLLHGTSAGSAGTYFLAWGLQQQGDPPAGIVADGYVVNQEWLQATVDQQIPCPGRNEANSNAAVFATRIHPELALVTNEPDRLVASGRLAVPIVHIWNHGDPLSCGSAPMLCPLHDGTQVTLGAVDCQSEPLRRAIAAQGPTSRSVNGPACVANPANPDPTNPCNKHVITTIAGTNTDPASPADYNAAIMDWVHTRLTE